MEGLPHDRDLAQTLPEPHQRADYLAYDSRPPPPYSASQNAARADPNQVRMASITALDAFSIDVFLEHILCSFTTASGRIWSTILR